MPSSGQTSPPAKRAGDWPQFRGPGGMATRQESKPPVSWSAEENLLWKTELPGAGGSSPIVIGDRIFLTCYDGYNVPGKEKGEQGSLKRIIAAFTLNDGKSAWTQEVKSELPEEERIREGHGYASNTPAADSERLFVFFGKSGVFAFSHDGRQAWHAGVGSGTSGWGSAASPVLYKDLVIINASVESTAIVAFGKKTGAEAWRADGIKEAWNTPILVEVAPGKNELVVGVPKKLLAFEPETGKPLWSCNHGINWYICPSAVARDGIVYLIGGRSGGGAVAVRAGGRGDVTSSHRVWNLGKGSNVPSPVLHGGHLYFAHDNLGIFYCLDARNGEVVYEQRLEPSPGQIYSSPILADNRLYYLSRGGQAIVIAARPRFEVLAQNKLAGDRGAFNASPAIAGDRLLLRSDRYLYCIGK